MTTRWMLVAILGSVIMALTGGKTKDESSEEEDKVEGTGEGVLAHQENRHNLCRPDRLT